MCHKHQPTSQLTIQKSDLYDKANQKFFQAVAVSVLLYGCTTWNLLKRLETKLEGIYTRMLRAILNKSCKQHHPKQQLYDHLPPFSPTIPVIQTRHDAYCC